MPLLTVGHGPDDRARLAARLTGAGIGRVVDVRRFPGSRNNPDVDRATPSPVAARGRDRLPLGGAARRPAPAAAAGEPVADGWWTVAQFAAYAAHTRTPEFASALDAVLTEARRSRGRGDVQRERVVALPPAADRRRRRPRTGFR